MLMFCCSSYESGFRSPLFCLCYLLPDFFLRVAAILLPWTLTVVCFAYFFYTLRKATLLLPLVAFVLSNPDALDNVPLSLHLDLPSPARTVSEARLGRAFEGVPSCANTRGSLCIGAACRVVFHCF